MKLRVLSAIYLISLVMPGILTVFCALLFASGETGGTNKRVSQDTVPVTVTVVSSSALPRGFELRQNYPNPFNPSTTIRYSIPVDTKVTLEILDVLGRKIKTLVDAVQPAGFHSCLWNARDLPSGVYLCRMKAGKYAKTLKMLQLK